MSPMSSVQNPFMLMVQPEVVLAAIQKSEKLGSLNRHLCRPLDRPMAQPAAGPDLDDDAEDVRSDEVAVPRSA